MTHDPVLQRIGDAIAASRPDPTLARTQLAALWESVGPAGDPLYRCAIAHAMADVQTSPSDELVWDLRALEAGVLLDDERLASAGMATSVNALLSSLHLNLADVYRRLGNATASREHVEAGNAAVAALAGDGYADVVREALARIDSALPHVHGPHCRH